MALLVLRLVYCLLLIVLFVWLFLFWLCSFKDWLRVLYDGQFCSPMPDVRSWGRACIMVDIGAMYVHAHRMSLTISTLVVGGVSGH